MAEKQGLETLEIWRRSVDFAVEVCQNVLPHIPQEEKWALASQLRRSVQSIPANIAEGYGRYNYQESIRFCYIARGSMAETKTHLLLANRLNYLDSSVYQKYLEDLTELGKMLHGYVAFLRKQKKTYRVDEIPGNNELYDI